MMAALLPIALLLAPAATPSYPGNAAAVRASAKAYVNKLYARYYPNGPGVHLRAVAAPSLAKLLALDDQQAQANGDGGTIDYDPICQCQDWNRIAVRWLGLDIVPSGAIARVELTHHFLTPDGKHTRPEKPKRVTFTLQRSGQVWRIADIGDQYMPSLRKMLESELKPTSGGKK